MISFLMKLIVILSGVSLCFPIVLNAQTDDLIKKDDMLNLNRCTEIALKKHPSVIAATNTIDVNQNRIGQAASNYYPQISWSSGYSRNDGIQSYNQYSSNFTLNQNIYDFGKTASQTKIQQLNYISSKSDLENISNQVIFNVKQAYYGLLQAKRNRDVAIETVDQFQQHLKQAKGFFQVGTRAKFDVTRAEVDLSNAKLNLIRTENALRIAKVNLNNAIGLPYAPEYAIEDNFDFQKYEITFENATHRAYANRHDLQSLIIKEKAAEESIALAQKEYYPTMSGNASYSWSGEEFPLDRGWKAGATVTFPLFSGYSTQYRVDESKAALNVLKANKESIKQGILLEIQQAYLNLREAEERIDAAELTVKQARENLDLVNGRYTAGVGNPIEVTDAQVAYSNAKTTYNQALYDYKLAQASITKAMGER